jgi:hypothetical protein
MNSMQKKLIWLTAIGILLMLFTGCADVSHVQPCLTPTEHTYGFWGGVWHGAILQFAFLCSLFNNDVAIYAVNNNGAWYNFGFVGGLGLMIRFVTAVVKAVLKK